MGMLREYLNEYFKTTPREVLKRRWDELEYLDEVGPSVMEYLENVYGYSMPNIGEMKLINNELSDRESSFVTECELYYLAA